MPNVQITDLPAALPLDGTELVPIVQSGVTVRTTTAAVAGSPAQNQTFITASLENTLPNSRYLGVGDGLSISDLGAQNVFRISVTGELKNLIDAPTGLIAKTGGTAITSRALQVSGQGLSITNGSGVAGDPTIALDGLSAAISGLSGFGQLTLLGTSATVRQLVGTVGQIEITDPQGTSGNPTFNLAQTGVVAGTYGDASSALTVSVDAQGRLTYITSTPIALSASQITTGTLPIARGGTGAGNANDALNNLLPSQTGQNGKVLATDGTDTFWQTGGTGTVTSVGLALPADFTVTNSPVTTSGTLTATWTSVASNTVFAGPNGTSGTPTFRALVNDDLPASGVVANVYGSSTKVPVITVNSKGVLTSVSESTIIGTLSYQGTWDASTNTPTLTSSVGTAGYYYAVSVAGTTNLNGITDWEIGDWAIFNGTAWQKIDQTNAVTSVNGFTGAVTLDYADVGAPSTTGTNASGTWAIDITGNAATATSATSATSATTANAVANAVTFNSSGGASPGTTFDGSVARTIDYSSVGAPKADGTGASGTWGINISGNAATATSATSATTATNVAGGLANEIVYQTAASTSGFITAPTVASTFLQWNGSAFTWASVAGAGTVTSVDVSGGSTGLTFSGGPITTSGTISMAGTLAVGYGGTGATTDSGARANLGAAASGANADITSMSSITGGISTPDFINFDNALVAAPTTVEGGLYYNNDDNTATLQLIGNNGINLKLNEEQYYRVKAASNITKGQVLMFTGTVGASGGLIAAPATGLTAEQSNYILGIATETITTGNWGYATFFGEIRGLNTTGGAEAWVDGTVLYYNPAVTGGLTKNKPAVPNAIAIVAAVVHTNASNGILFVRPTFGSVLGGTDGNVSFSSLNNNDVIVYDGTGMYWKNVAQSTLSVGTASKVANAVTFNSSGGASPGTTFDGSAARTIDYSSVGAPKADGTGASGTWGINITGNAATATSATSATSATTATNIAGGSAGSLPYNSGAGTTTFLSLGNTNYVLTAGATAPQYVDQSTLSVGSATNATNVATTLTSTNANFYVPFVAAASTSNQALGVDAGITYNPSTNAITAGISGGTF